MTTARAAIESLGLTMSAEFVPFSHSRNANPEPKLDDLSLNWKVTIHHNGREVMTTDYGAGIGHAPGYKAEPRPGIAPGTWKYHRYQVVRKECETGIEHRIAYHDTAVPASPRKPILPTIEDVLYCLVSDADAIDHPTFESWASDLGYDPDSRSAETAYRACLETALKFRAALGDDGLARLREAFQDF